MSQVGIEPQGTLKACNLVVSACLQILRMNVSGATPRTGQNRVAALNILKNPASNHICYSQIESQSGGSR